MIDFQTLLVHFALLLALPPLLLGVINKTKAWFAGRRGPPLLQPYYDLRAPVPQGDGLQPDDHLGLPRGPVVGVSAVAAGGLAGSLRRLRRARPLHRRSRAVRLPDGSRSLLHDRGRAGYGLRLRRHGSRARGVVRLPRGGRAVHGVRRAGPLLGLAQPDADAPRADDSLRFTACPAAALFLVAVALFVVLLAENCADSRRRSQHAPRAHDDPRGDGPRSQRAALRPRSVRRGGEAVPAVGPAPAPRPARSRSAIRCSTGCSFVAGIGAIAVGIGVVESVMARLRLRYVPSLLIASAVLCVFGFVLTLA